MKLICQDFTFYSNGIYSNKTSYDSNTNSYFTDSQKVSEAIRLFGTEADVQKALKEFVDYSGLNLNECYNFDTPSKLEQYKEIYLKNNTNARKSKAILINLI
jgi:hypothetical protein